LKKLKVKRLKVKGFEDSRGLGFEGAREGIDTKDLFICEESLLP